MVGEEEGYPQGVSAVFNHDASKQRSTTRYSTLGTPVSMISSRERKSVRRRYCLTSVRRRYCLDLLQNSAVKGIASPKHACARNTLDLSRRIAPGILTLDFSKLLCFRNWGFLARGS